LVKAGPWGDKWYIDYIQELRDFAVLIPLFFKCHLLMFAGTHRTDPAAKSPVGQLIACDAPPGHLSRVGQAHYSLYG
jgi:hypothetical protein